MNTAQKVERAIEIAHNETGLAFNYLTDDRGRVESIFDWHAPKRAIYGPFSGSSIKEIVSWLKNLVE